MADSDEKTIIMSFSVRPDMQEMLKTSAKSKNCSVSKLFRQLVLKYLPIFMNEGTEIPVMLRIPQEMRTDEDNLRKWLAPRVDAIIKKLVKPNIA